MAMRAMAAVVGWGAIAMTAYAADPIVVDAPAIVAGDRWDFASTRNGNSSTLTVEVLERGGDGRLRVKVVRAGRETIEFRDASMNFLFGGRLDRPQVVVRYPLRDGGNWRFDQPTDSANASYSGEGRVVAQRSLTVPAGTFECLEVESTARYSFDRSYNNELKVTRWYCPAIKWYAMETFTSMTLTAYNPAENGTNTVENRLLKFTPGKP